LLSTKHSFEMTYLRDMLFTLNNTLAKSFCTGSDHPELPRMIRANSDFQHWASLDDSVLHRMIWTHRSGRPVWPVWLRAIYLHIPKWEMMLWIIIWRTLSLKGPKWIHKSGSKYCKHNFNSCKLFLCFDQSCKWASLYSLSNKVPPSKDIQNLRHWLRGSSFSNLCHSWD